jgi:hypothetical protein
MRIHVDEQNEIYDTYWLPMQNGLQGSLTQCIRHYMMKDGTLIKQGDVYFALKDRVQAEDALTALRDIAEFAAYYLRLLYPDIEPNTAISNALKRLNRLEITTAYPFLLNCYRDYRDC